MGRLVYLVAAHAFLPRVGLAQIIRPQTPDFCATPIEKLLNPIEILEHGYFWDASVVLTRVLDKSVSYEDLKSIAFKQAKTQGHQSVGICATSDPFVVSYSSKSALQKNTEGKMIIPLAELKAECDPVEFMWASEIAVTSIPLQEVLDLSSLGTGSFGISCVRKNALNQGPELRYLIGEKWTMPSWVFAKNKSYESTEDVRAWLNSIRQRTSCKAQDIAFRILDPQIAKELRPQTQHDMSWLQRASDFYNHEAHSEERSQGRNLQEALSLLWISPFHRKSLLDCAVSSVAITLQKLNHGVFLHLLFFKNKASRYMDSTKFVKDLY